MARKPKRHVEYPYPELRAGDIVCCDTRGMFPVLTRIFTGGGMKHAFDHTVSTHTGIIIPIGKQLFVGEMERKGVTLSSLETKYQKRRERIICFRRVPHLTSHGRQIITEEFAELYRRSMEYDFKGLLEFVSRRVKDSKHRMYCSEMVYILTRPHMPAGRKYPPALDVKVSPQTLLTTHCLDTIWHR